MWMLQFAATGIASECHSWACLCVAGIFPTPIQSAICRADTFSHPGQRINARTVSLHHPFRMSFCLSVSLRSIVDAHDENLGANMASNGELSVGLATKTECSRSTIFASC